MPNNKLEKIHLGLETKEQFLQKYSVPSCLVIYNHVRNIEIALKEQSPSLVSFTKEYSKDYVLAYIEMWILSLNEFVNLKYEMSPKQMKETSCYIYQDFFYFKISDITLLFTNAKKGHYRGFFHTLDGTMILGWFTKYAEERSEIAESVSIQEANEQTEPDKQRTSNDDKFQTIKHGYELSKFANKHKGLDTGEAKRKGRKRKDK